MSVRTAGICALALTTLSGCWWLGGVVRPVVVVQPTGSAPPPQADPGAPPPPPPAQAQEAPPPPAPVAVATAPSGGTPVFAYSPQMAPFYVNFLFMMAFYPAGMAVTTVPYQPGQYTRWSFPFHNNTASWIEQARLADDPQGNQWWKVKFHDGGSGKTTILEGLFSPDRGRLLRLRAQFPDDGVGAELPVTAGQYYMAPAARLTPESLGGATVGTDSITTPAGTFMARHVVFGGGRGSLEWWLADNVPGGTVRESVHSNRTGADRALMELQAFGSDAVSELGSH